LINRALKISKPEIFNSDQGPQYTSESFIDVLKEEDIRISMDGRGRLYDNIVVERLWRTVKYEEVYLHDYRSVSEAREKLAYYFNFVKTMLRLGKEKEVLRVVDDQYGCPTYAADLAEAIMTILSKVVENRDIAWGTYHFCGAGKTTWHGFAKKISQLASQYDSLAIKTVESVITEEYPTPAKRPANLVMDCSMLRRNFGIRPAPWEESLAWMVNEIYSG